MPKLLKFVLGILIFTTLLDLAAVILLQTGEKVATFILSILIILGILSKHRLAWQWGKLLMGFTFFILTFVLSIAILDSSYPINRYELVSLIFSDIVAFIVYISFSVKSIREYFNTVCPICSSKNIKANDFFFNKGRCRDCNHIW